MKIFTFDTTLRDGTQGESISFSVDDKLIIAQKLDELGIDYIEGGWPGSQPQGQGVLRARRASSTCTHARLTAFGSTRFAKNPVDEDRNVRALVEAGTPGRLHLRQDLGPSRQARPRHHRRRKPRPHLRDRRATSRITARKSSTTPSISSTATSPTPITPCARSKPRSRPAPTCSASATPTAARSPAASGRDRRRSAPAASMASSASTRTTIPMSPSANTLAAVEAGATHVQGCMNGYGERCGNANLASRHRQPRTQTRPHHHRPREARQPRRRSAASSPSWPTCRCATTSPSSARAPSPTRAACTSAPC